MLSLFLVIATVLGGIIFFIGFMGYIADIPLIRQVSGEGIIGTGAAALILVSSITIAFILKFIFRKDKERDEEETYIPIEPVPQFSQTKACPYCMKSINLFSIKCTYCFAELEREIRFASANVAPRTNVKPDEKNDKTTLAWFWGDTFSALLLVVCIVVSAWAVRSFLSFLN